MGAGFKPMLAGKAPEALSDLVFPLFVSPKLDGVRCIIRGGVAVSRKLLPIPNAHVQRLLAGLPDGLDGELMLRSGAGFNAVQSAVMRETGEPDVVFNVFDCDVQGDGFETRFATASRIVKLAARDAVTMVPHRFVQSVDELLRIESCALSDGFEGVMIRSLNGPYKYGRSSTREAYLLKLKRFEDAEATIVGAVELMHNENEAGRDELGRTKRSSAKAGKVPGGTLGALVLERPDGVRFECGTGFDTAMRAELWAQRDTLIEAGALAKYKFQPDPAAPQNKPRFPVFLGLRDRRDT